MSTQDFDRLEVEFARLAREVSILRAEVRSAPSVGVLRGGISPRSDLVTAAAEHAQSLADSTGAIQQLVDECGGLLTETHLELARTLGKREQQVGDLERQLGESEQREAALSRQLGESEQREAARVEEMVREQGRLSTEADRIRTDLARIHGSRWWRVGSVYWALQRRVDRSLRQVASRLRRDSAEATPSPSRPEPVEPLSVSTPPGPAAEQAAPSLPTDSSAALFDVVCFPIIDWGFRFQRPQQLMKRLGARGHRVFYLAQAFRADGPPYTVDRVEHNVWEVSLRARPANVYQDQLSPEAATELFASLNALRRDLSLGATLSIVQLPFWWPVAKKAWEEHAWPVVYDCMDDHAGFSTNRPEMLAQEEELLRGARLVCASSEKLHERASQLNPSHLILPNGCDMDHFSKVGPAPHGPRPRIGYYGAIADWFDADLVADLAERRRDWDFVLVGSTFTADTSRLVRQPNVTLPGEQPYADLPAWLDRFDVLLIPFKRVPLTEATNPVKAYEILAAGRPLVSVPLPEVRALQPHVRLASTADEFEREIAVALATDSPEEVARRRAFAAQHTWEERVDRLLPALRSTFPLASVVVVTYNNLALNRQCLESVYGRTEWPNLEVIAVDNASEDGTPEYLAEALREFPTLHVVLNDGNEGFARANNVGLARAAGAFLVLLNNDTIVSRGWLAALIRHLQRDPTLGMVGPSSNAVGNEAEIPVGYQDVAGMPAWAAEYVLEHDGESFDIPMLGMFCVAMRRDVFEKVGGLDERFEIGMFEDDDYARRVRLAGYRMTCVRDSFVHHWQKASFRLLGEPEYLKLYHRNRRRFDEKWGGEVRSAVAVPSPAGLEALYAAAATAKGVVVFPPSIGWGVHLFQRPHHLARALAGMGYAVVYDCSNAHDDVARLRELEPRLFLYRGAPEDLHALHEPIVWTFPYNFHFAESFPYGARTVYDWIDDLSVFTVWDKELVRRNHERALEKATVVAAVARPLHLEALRTRPDALYLPNAVDYGHFADLPERVRDPKLVGLPEGRPVAGYYGALAKWFDDEMLDETAARRPDWSFVLVGPMYEGGLRGARSLRRPNVIWMGPRDYRTLPAYAAWFDVALIPFRLDAITRATSPLKLYEYFAAGRPVISTALPECESFPEVRIVRSAEELSGALDAARADGRDPQFVERLRSIGRQNSWDARVETVLGCFGEAADGTPPRGRPGGNSRG